jgi:ATP synthase assembly factor FMC1
MPSLPFRRITSAHQSTEQPFLAKNHTASRMSYQPRLRSLYRRFLRELPAPTVTPNALSKSKPSILSHPSPVQKRIRTSFAEPHNTTAPESRIHEAEQYVHYLKSQRTYATLVERYNPGMNMDEEERVRLSARRVGMEMPVEFGVNGKDGGKS